MANIVNLGQALRQGRPQQQVNPKSALGQALFRRGNRVNVNEAGSGIRSAGESILGALLLKMGQEERLDRDETQQAKMNALIASQNPDLHGGVQLGQQFNSQSPDAPSNQPQQPIIPGDPLPQEIREQAFDPANPNSAGLAQVLSPQGPTNTPIPQPPGMPDQDDFLPQTIVNKDRGRLQDINKMFPAGMPPELFLGMEQNKQLQAREDQIRKEDREFKVGDIKNEQQFTFKRDELKFGRDVALKMLAQKPTKKGTLWEHLTTAGYIEGSKEWDNAARAWLAKKSGTNVTLNTAQKAVEQLGKKMADLTIDQQDQAEKSVDGLNNIVAARQFLDEGIRTGTGANFMTSLNSFLVSRMGFDSGSDKTQNTQAFAAIIARQTLKILGSGDLGAGTGLSDADREFAERVGAASIEIDERAIRRIMDINEDVFRRSLQRFNKRATHVNKWVSDQGSSLPFKLGVPIPTKRETKKAGTPDPAIVPPGQAPPSSGVKNPGPKHLKFDSKGNPIK